jgi:hypothetical protein
VWLQTVNVTLGAELAS